MNKQFDLYFLGLAVAAGLLGAAACGRDKEQIVREKVAERVEAFNKKKREECREALLETAEERVDSLLLMEAQNALNDSLARARPGRPFQPPAVPPIDSLKIQPIFNGIEPASSTGGR
ncbi:MAG: hypothetical protein SFV22_03780 [Saprospiraceae bacterium]|nr:hypothetical protein [Saprospiraceae bacterium]